MKKIFLTLMVCILVTIGVTFVTRTNFLQDSLVKDVELEQISINDFGITNSTYWYNTLSDDEKRVYRIIANGVMNLDKNIIIDVTREKDFEDVRGNIEVALNAFFADHPEVFYVDDKYEMSMINMLIIKTISLKLDYVSNNIKGIENMKQELNNEIESINSRLVNAKTDYEKELLIHDILAEEVEYFSHEDYNDIPSIKHTAYAALVDKSAVCDGITKAFQILLNKHKIESIFVTGVSEEVAHAWCKVKLDNDYYNVDVTSDKALNSENSKLVTHGYFNVTDKEISSTHTFDNYEKLPASNNNKYNYYVYNDYTISFMDDFQYKLGQIAKSQASKSLLEFNATGINDVPSKMVDALYNINFNNFKTNNITKIEYNQINDNYIVVK